MKMARSPSINSGWAVQESHFNFLGCARTYESVRRLEFDDLREFRLFGDSPIKTPENRLHFQPPWIEGRPVGKPVFRIHIRPGAGTIVVRTHNQIIRRSKENNQWNSLHLIQKNEPATSLPQAHEKRNAYASSQLALSNLTASDSALARSLPLRPHSKLTKSW